MSCLVMRPDAPVPGMLRRSMLFSEAILRTSGEERGASPVEAEGVAAGVGAPGAALGVGAVGAGFGVDAGAAAPPPMTAGPRCSP